MDPIAIYEEHRFDGSRTFRLYSDRVVVKGKTALGPEFDTTILLNSLQPVASTVRSRTNGFWQGVWMALPALLILESGLVSPTSSLGVLAIVFTIGGALLSLCTARKIEWAYVSSHAGVVVLTIARSGKQQEAFAPFVQALLKQIQVAAQPGSSIA
jgi:hypothetical protein